MNIIVRVFGHRLFRGHYSTGNWSETFMNMMVRVIGLRLFQEHASMSIWP